MKKVALLTIFMLIFALASFAQVDVTVEGNSELSFGIALDSPIATGFSNSNSAKISFSLGSGDAEKGAEEDVYGWIKISGWKIDYNTDDAAWDIGAGDVEAKIMFPGGWVKISGTNNSFNFVNSVQEDDGDNDNDNAALSTAIGSNAQGVVLGLDFAPAAIELGIFSEGDWTTNADNAYGAALKLSLDVAPIMVEVGACMGLNYTPDSPIGVGGKVSVDVAPITAYAAADVNMDGGTTSMEFGGGLGLTVVDGLSVAVDASYCDDAAQNTDLKVSVTEDGAGGIVPALGATVTFEMYNILGQSAGGVNPDDDDAADWLATVGLDYTTDTMKPYANVSYGNFTYDADNDTVTYLADEAFKLNLGVELYLITNVTFTVDYNSDDLANSNGVVKLITKIAY